MHIDFRPLAQNDLPQLHIWLNTDFVLKWFGKKPTPLNDVIEKYDPYITGEKPTSAYIIVIGGIDTGYIQTYLISDYPDYNAYVGADEHSAGVDLFIGHRDYIHKGYGASIMTAFLKDYVFSKSQVARCIIGPEPKNTAAIRMYEKTGFRWYKTIQVPGEDAPEYLMTLTKKDFFADLDERRLNI
jgi:aminoglycoside 6'-N-acetyltransferase